MKTYEEMAQSVMNRAQAHRTRRNRMLCCGTLAAVCAFGICLATMAMRPQTPTLQAAPDTETVAPAAEAPRITFLHNDTNGLSPMTPGVSVPFCSQLRLQSIAGMTDEQIDALVLQEQEYAEALKATYPEAGNLGSMIQMDGREKYDQILTFVNVGYFTLRIREPENVESIHGSLKNGTMCFLGDPWERENKPETPEEVLAYPQPREYVLKQNELQDHDHLRDEGIRTTCLLSSQLMYHYLDNPGPLSQISETITFTVNYTDGTVETHAIDMIFTDTGDVYALYQGLSAEA